MTQNHALRGENSELTHRVRWRPCEKASLLARCVRPPASLTTTHPPKRLMDSARLPEFLIQAASYIRFLEARFSNDTLKVAFLTSRLTGTAEEWVVPYIERGRPILAQFRGLRGPAEAGVWLKRVENKPVGTPHLGRDGCEPLHLALMQKELSIASRPFG